tara:strand:+ start:797 stop:1015 length:219 start_codon:yes stop_codon:yes gene_type:complete
MLFNKVVGENMSRNTEVEARHYLVNESLPFVILAPHFLSYLHSQHTTSTMVVLPVLEWLRVWELCMEGNASL